MLKFLLLLISILVSFYSISQEVDVVNLEIEKEIPEEAFSKNRLIIDFWVKADDFSSINVEKTQLLTLKDDTGYDLLKAHNTALGIYNTETERLSKEEGRLRFSSSASSLFRPQDWKAMRDTIGFKAGIHSEMIRPGQGAKKIEIKMKVVYNAEGNSQELESEEIEIPSLYNNPKIDFKDNKIWLLNNQSMTLEGKKYIFYEIPLSKANVSIARVEVSQEITAKYPEAVLNAAGKNQFLVSEEDAKELLTVKIFYSPVFEKEIEIHKWITLGL